MRDVASLSQVELAEGAGQADALPAPEEASEDGGFLASVEDAPETDAPPRRGGLLGFFTGRAAAERGGADEAPEAEPDPAALVEQAARSDVRAKPEGGGFLSALFGGRATPNAPDDRADYTEAGPGVTLPFGEMARLCGVPDRILGQRVARYPERGRGYRLYDSQPDSNAAHSWYITGFDDGCARQFTAALAMFGGPEQYELLRYGPAGETLPVSVTDSAYETLTSRVCGVAEGTPCGNRIGRLERDTVFVTIYPSFGGSGAWKNLLLHDGAVLATDIKEN